MLEEKIMDAFNSIDDEYIESAYMQKRSFNKAVLVAAAAIILAAALSAAIGLNLKKSEVVYADFLDYSSLLLGIPDDKIDFIGDFSKYSPEDRLRIMIIIYDIQNGYPEIYNREYDGQTLSEMMEAYEYDIQKNNETFDSPSEWNKISEITQQIYDEMYLEEEKWLQSVGADDLEKISDNIWTLTINAEKFTDLYYGKCTYRVLLSPENIDSSFNKNINSFFGEYVCSEVVYIPLTSSYSGPPEQEIERYYLTMDEDMFLLSGNYDLSLGMCNPSYIINTEVDNVDSCFGFSSMDIMFMDEELMKLFASEHIIADVKDDVRSVRIYIGNNAVYVDRGRYGIYKFSYYKPIG